MRKTPRPLVSVVCLSYNRLGSVLELLASLRNQDYDPFEVVLIDNCSHDGTPEAVENSFPEVKLIQCPQNFGMVAYNFGFANARGEYVLVIDDDGLPANSNWISEIVACLEANPRLAAVGCTIRMKDTGLVAYDNPRFIAEGKAETGFFTTAFNGTGAGLRAEALRQVGYYPFVFFRSWLEFHLCTRFWNAGWEVRYFPAIEVWHTRPSGSVDRPFSFYGLRNYLWCVWEFYPWPEVLIETLHYFGSRVKYTLQGKLTVSVLIKAFLAALGGWRNILTHRQPVSKSVIYYLRQIRKYGTHYCQIEKYRPFSPSPGQMSLDEAMPLRQTNS